MTTPAPGPSTGTAPLRVTVTEAVARLPGPAGERFARAMAHGTLLVEVYQPQGPDRQQPHDQDELYVVVQGRGRLRRDHDEVPCEPGDVLFVPAGVEHRFVGASADFVVWVIFYGPSGGEARAAAAAPPPPGKATPVPPGTAAPPPAAAAREDVYTHGHHASVLASHRWRTAGNSAAYLLPHLRPGQRLLDVGCGPGTITMDLALAVAPGEVVALDRSPDAIDAARQTAQERGVEGITFLPGDVYRLDLPDDSFDVVHAHQVLQHLTDPVSALREMRRVCKPDGVVAVRDADYAGFAWHPADPALDRWLASYRAAARANGAEPDAGRRLLAWARAAGFAQITPGASTWCFATPEDRAWWGRTTAERVTRSDLADQLRQQGLSAEDLERIAAAWLRWSEHPDGWLLIPSAELLARP